MNSTRRSQVHRNLENRHLREMAGHETCYPDFPILNTLTAPLRKASAEKNTPDFLSLWSGQSAAMSRNMPAGELIQALVTETESVLEFMATRRQKRRLPYIDNISYILDKKLNHMENIK